MRRYIHFTDLAYCTFHFDMTKICFLIQFRADQFVARDAASHKQYCERIEADSGRAGYSVTYGINRTSILIKAHHFDVTKCLPYDIMHTLFEGVAPYVPFKIVTSNHNQRQGLPDSTTAESSVFSALLWLLRV